MSIINNIFKKDDTKKGTSDTKSVNESKTIDVKNSSDSKKGKKKATKKKDDSKSTTVSKRETVIKQPWVSEKARDKVADNQFVFLVENSANKTSIKEEVERKWNVKVESVNTIKKGIRPKKFAGRPGRTRMIKKAIVTLKEGDTIDIYPV